MPRRIIDWETTEAFSKFGFEDGDGPNFTDEVVSAIEAAGPYRCRTQIWGLHNYAIETVEEQIAPDEWVRVAEFDRPLRSLGPIMVPFGIRGAPLRRGGHGAPGGRRRMALMHPARDRAAFRCRAPRRARSPECER